MNRAALNSVSVGEIRFPLQETGRSCPYPSQLRKEAMTALNGAASLCVWSGNNQRRRFAVRLGSLISLALSAAMLLNPISAQAGLDATVDLTNPRIVPVYVSQTGQVPSSRVHFGWSGFLYSSRIVFSAAHTEIGFDNNGNKVRFDRPFILVGQPNTRAGESAGAVQVIKSIIAEDYRNQFLDDFNILLVTSPKSLA